MNAPRLLEGLPGIDWVSPDTYETADEQPDHLNDALNVEKCDDTAVSKIDTSVKDVRVALKDKYLDSGRVDFSDAPVKAVRTGYANLEFVSGEETPSQRLHRIKSELDELSGQLAVNTSEKADISVTEMLQEIDQLRRRVGTVINAQVSAKLAIPRSADSKAVDELRRMIVSSSDATANLPVYRLYHNVDLDKQYQIAKAVELEARLSRVESVVGNTAPSGSVSHVAGSDSQKRDGILEQLSTLESKMSLLDPAKLDLIDARLATVISRIQALSSVPQTQPSSDPTPQPIDPVKLQKLLQLQELLASSTENIHVLPKVVDRLTALSDLHSQALQIVDAMAFVEKSQTQLDAQLNSCQQLLEGVSRSLEQSSADIATYCKRVEESEKAHPKH